MPSAPVFRSAEALRLQREELEAKVAHSDARLAERKAAQLREIEERRLAAALAEVRLNSILIRFLTRF